MLSMSRTKARPSISSKSQRSGSIFDLWPWQPHASSLGLMRSQRCFEPLFFSELRATRCTTICKPPRSSYKFQIVTDKSPCFSALTVARCIAICKPLKAHLILTRRKAKLQMALALVVVTLFNIQFFFAITLNQVGTTSANQTAVYQCNSVKGRKVYPITVQ